MITTIDLIRTLTELLEKTIPDYPVVDRDVEESVERPSTVIDLREASTHKMNVMFADRYDLEIFIFAADRHSGFLELLKIKNKLRFLLDEPIVCFEQEEFFFDLENVEYYTNKKDQVLQITCTVKTMQKDDRPDETPYADSLSFSLRASDYAKPVLGEIASGLSSEETEEDMEDFVGAEIDGGGN